MATLPLAVRHSLFATRSLIAARPPAETGLDAAIMSRHRAVGFIRCSRLPACRSGRASARYSTSAASVRVIRALCGAPRARA